MPNIIKGESRKIKIYFLVDLHELFLLVESQGGYDGCIAARCWKQVYDELGAAPNNPSAERSVRRLYERYRKLILSSYFKKNVMK